MSTKLNAPFFQCFGPDPIQFFSLEEPFLYMKRRYLEDHDDEEETQMLASLVLSNQNSLFDKDAFKKSAQHSNATHFLICIQCFECPQVFVRKYAHSIYNSIDSKKNVFFL